jgi:hypothetical protein
MPRERTVTMGIISPKESHEAAIAKTIKRNKPYEVVDGELLSQEEDKYYVVYTAPRGGDRKVIAGRNVKGNAIKLRDMLNEAWAEGMWSSNRISLGEHGKP